jgi:multidrug efflux pump subunit AcrB
MKQKIKEFKEFFATSWAIDNKTSVYVLIIFVSLLGFISYINIPKEQFPEIIIPTIIVNTPYPGTSPEDIENLVTRPIEKQVKSISGVKKITSNSVQDFSSIAVEFNTNVDVPIAKQRVKDAVDKAKANLPNNLPQQPDIMEVDISEFPIMYINISGNYDLNKLKEYADYAQDRIEGLKEITRVDIVGALDREIQINVDMYKMQAAYVTLRDIQNAVAYENMTVSAGTITTQGMKRSIRIAGQFKSVDDIYNISVKTSKGGTIFIKDIADIKDDYKEQESFSRLNNQNVITLNVIKRGGENLIDASDKIKDIINNDLKGKLYPDDLKVTITGDQSKFTRNTLDELVNTEIIGFILVIIVLMFFMGFSSAFFVGLSVPLSMFVAYMIMPGLGFTMNMIVMFGFIFALGIVVDDAIVVIENTHRIHTKEKNIVKAAKMAAGEVFMPILSGTLTTLAPFFPLAFWPGMVGKFMYYLPVTLILTLFASLFVAYIINPVFAVDFMKHQGNQKYEKMPRKKILKVSFIIGILALLSYASKLTGIGNFFICILALFYFYQFIFRIWINIFQQNFWPWVMRVYERTLRFFVRGKNSYWLFISIVGLFVITIILLGIKKPSVLFFPDNEPNSVIVYMTLPVGTDQIVTDSVARIIEKRVYDVIGQNNPDVESVITNVAKGAGEGGVFDRSVASNKASITVNFVEFKFRQGKATHLYLEEIRDKVQNMAGVNIVVQKNKMGPPTGKPLNIEIVGEDMQELIETANNYQKYLDSLQIPGIEKLKSDFDNNKPEIVIKIDRERANIEGISTGQIASEIRTAVFGMEISKYKDNEDEYPITLRYAGAQRKNIDQLLNLKITFMDMTTGTVRQIPLASVAKIEYRDTYGGIKRINLKRVITIYSEITTGHTANEVLSKVRKVTKDFTTPKNVEISFTGENEQQAESMAFLSKALLISIGLIFFILITQFNSLWRAMIILSEVLFSIIGVFLGIIIFDMSISVIMTGLGIVALAGIVVRNGILIVEFTDVLIERGYKTREAIVQAGIIRTTPVILTATATILGLLALAVGFNINFVTMFTEFNPHIHFGGDNVMFWGNLCWTIIFGLSFSTFLTLILVPAMYFILHAYNARRARNKSNRIYRRQLKAANNK